MADRDVIFDIIQANKAAQAAYDAMNTCGADEAGAYEIWWASYLALFTTRPALLAGVVALLKRMAEPVGGGELVADLMVGNWSGDPIEGQPGVGDWLRLLAEALAAQAAGADRRRTENAEMRAALAGGVYQRVEDNASAVRGEDQGGEPCDP